MQSKKLKLWLFPFIILIIISISGIVFAINTINTWYQTITVNQIVDAHGICQQVRHTWSKSYFIPTKTSAEWSAFRSNKPEDVILSPCSSPSWTYWSPVVIWCNPMQTAGPPPSTCSPIWSKIITNYPPVNQPCQDYWAIVELTCQ